LARAVEMFGQTRPIVIDETGTILVGNGLVEVFRRLQRPTIMALRMVDLTPDKKTKLMLADNKIFDLGIADNEAILSAITSLDDFDIPGFDADVLRSLTAHNADVEALAVGRFGQLAPGVAAAQAQRQVPPGSTDPGASAPTTLAPDPGPTGIICPKCGHLIPRP
jgi:hypothetical protein